MLMWVNLRLNGWSLKSVFKKIEKSTKQDKSAFENIIQGEQKGTEDGRNSEQAVGKVD